MNIVDTQSPKKDRFVTREDGTIDLDSYIGLDATFPVGKINVLVKTIGARTRYGHLDLNIKPVAGEGTQWVEYKNLMLHNDPIIAIIKATAPSGPEFRTVFTNEPATSYPMSFVNTEIIADEVAVLSSNH